MNFDGNLVKSLVIFPLFVASIINRTFEPISILYINIVCLCYILSIILYSYALKFGKGSTVQAVDANKDIIHAILAMISKK